MAEDKFIVRSYLQDSDLEKSINSRFAEGYVLAHVCMGFSYEWSLNNTQYRYTAVFVKDARIRADAMPVEEKDAKPEA